MKENYLAANPVENNDIVIKMKKSYPGANQEIQPVLSLLALRVQQLHNLSKTQCNSGEDFDVCKKKCHKNCKSRSTDYLKLAGVPHMSSTAEVGINTRYCHKSHLVMTMVMMVTMVMIMRTADQSSLAKQQLGSCR